MREPEVLHNNQLYVHYRNFAHALRTPDAFDRFFDLAVAADHAHEF